MKNINDIWGFIEENYEGYYDSDAVLEHDILTRFIENDAADDDDIKLIKDNFKSAEEIKDKLIVNTTKLMCKAIFVHYGKLFKQIGEKVDERLKECIMLNKKDMTNKEKAKELANAYSVWVSECKTLEDYYSTSYMYIIGQLEKMAEWKDEQFKIQEQTLLWTVEHILDRLCIEGEAREIAIKEFTNDLEYYNEKEDDSKE